MTREKQGLRGQGLRAVSNEYVESGCVRVGACKKSIYVLSQHTYAHTTECCVIVCNFSFCFISVYLST